MKVWDVCAHFSVKLARLTVILELSDGLLRIAESLEVFLIAVFLYLTKVMTNIAESDEVFARRLQAQELGLYRPVPANPDAQTPLMVISFVFLLLFLLSKTSLFSCISGIVPTMTTTIRP